MRPDQLASSGATRRQLAVEEGGELGGEDLWVVLVAGVPGVRDCDVVGQWLALGPGAGAFDDVAVAVAVSVQEQGGYR